MEGLLGSRDKLRRSASAPTLDSLADSALRLETTPCSVLELHTLDDAVAQRLRATLEETQRELRAAVEAGVLRNSRQDGSDSEQGASDGEGTQPGGSRRHSGGSDRQRSSSADAGGSSGGQAPGLSADVADELELAGLSAREREAAIKRARNREAARRSRERKMERISGLQAEVDRLRANNFVLLKCVEEVATKALAARGEQRQLREQLARLTAARQAPAVALAACLPAVPPSDACTPPAARRAAALERQLQLLEAAPRSPTQLLPPLWALADADAPSAALEPPLPRPMPTSAELRRELREAVAGAGGSDSGGSSWGSAGGGAAEDRHLLHPSPGASRPGPAQPPSIQLPTLPTVVHLKQGDACLLRSCSAPSGLLVQAASEAAAAADQTLPQHWFRGVAA